MGNYNVDWNYNVPKMAYLARVCNFTSDFPVLCDQWSIDSAHRVSSFRGDHGRIDFLIAYDPRVIPP